MKFKKVMIGFIIATASMVTAVPAMAQVNQTAVYESSIEEIATEGENTISEFGYVLVDANGRAVRAATNTPKIPAGFQLYITQVNGTAFDISKETDVKISLKFDKKPTSVSVGYVRSKANDKNVILYTGSSSIPKAEFTTKFNDFYQFTIKNDGSETITVTSGTVTY